MRSGVSPSIFSGAKTSTRRLRAARSTVTTRPVMATSPVLARNSGVATISARTLASTKPASTSPTSSTMARERPNHSKMLAATSAAMVTATDGSASSAK